MANIEKFTKSESQRMIQHDLRENHSYKNKNIKTDKTKNNIVFCDRGKKYLDKRADEVYIYGKDGKKSNEIIYTGSVVCHYPSHCPVSEKIFFETLNEVLNEKFGEKNCILSVVHKDEYGDKFNPRTAKVEYSKNGSHLHYMFMPIVYDRKNEREKLCGKEVLNRELFRTFHKDVEKAMSEKLGKDIRITLTEKEKRNYIKDMDKYKEAMNMIDKACREEIIKNSVEIANLKDDQEYYQELVEREKELFGVEEFAKTQLQEEVEKLKEERDELLNEIEIDTQYKQNLIDKWNSLLESKSEFEIFVRQENENKELKERYSTLNKLYEDVVARLEKMQEYIFELHQMLTDFDLFDDFAKPIINKVFYGRDGEEREDDYEMER